MHLIGDKAYRTKYFGCLEAEDRFVCYLFPRGTFRPITTYAKEDFECHDHFLTARPKVVPRHLFLLQPVPLKSLGTCDLALVGEASTCLRRRGTGPRTMPIDLRADESGVA